MSSDSDITLNYYFFFQKFKLIPPNEQLGTLKLDRLYLVAEKASAPLDNPENAGQ
jgi:hypothetical protein